MKRFILITVALASFTSHSQEMISRNEYRELVLLESYSLQAVIEDRTTQETSLRAHQTSYLPTLSLSMSGSYQQPHYNGYDKLNGVADLVLSQTIYNGGVTRAQTQYKQTQIKQASFQISAQRWALFLMADQNYWRYQATQAQLSVAQRYVSIIDSLGQIVADRFEDGYISRTDLLMVQTRLLEARTAAIVAQENYQKANQTLIEQGGLRGYDIALTDQLVYDLTLPRSVVLEEVLSRRPDFQVSQSSIDLQEQTVRITRNGFNPKLTAGLKATLQNQNISMPEDFIYQGYLSVQTNLFHWGERKKSVSTARSALRSLELRQEQLERDISLELQTSFTSVQQSYNQVVVSQQNLALAQENLDLNTFSYTEGKRPIIDVLAAQISWVDAFTTAISASYQFKLAVSYYEYVSGEM